MKKLYHPSFICSKTEFSQMQLHIQPPLTSIVCMYSSYGNLSMARKIFDRMRNRDLVVWNTMINGYVQNSYEEEAVYLFYQLQYHGFVPNDTTYTCILKASSMMDDDKLGRSLHARTLKSGVLTDVFLGTALVDMYSKFLEILEAKRVFDEMKIRNLVSYNAVMAGYSLIGEYEEGLKAYLALRIEGMKPDSFTFIALFSSCSVSNAISEGVQLHSHSLMCGLESDSSVGNSIVNLYSKCGHVNCAMKAFESIHMPNSISWASIISGLAQNGENEKAINQFNKMHKLSEKPDEFTSSSVLKAAAGLASTEQGRHLHVLVIKRGLDGAVFVRTTLINMYSKYGLIDDAHKVFSYSHDKSVVPWNSMITGYAQNGFCKEALALFQEMTISEISPTSVTFTGVLFACSNGGFVEEGKNYYNLMTYTYKIMPSVEHCTCMVNLLGRAGYLDEAAKFILNSPYSNEPEIWGALLSACGVHKNVDLGSWVAQYCLRLVPRESTIFTFLSNMYASNELWGEASTARDYMKEMGIGKEPGYSSIEVRNIEIA